MASPAYRPRSPKVSPLWQSLFRHFDAFLGQYEERCRKRYGYLRPIILEVVNKFLDCGDGGGIYNNDMLTLTNSIVAGNTAIASPNIFGSFSGSYNLTAGDPQLAALGDYGGSTRTMLPMPGSPAIDAGTNTVLTTDQRGFARVVNGTVDIGAVEHQGSSDNDLIWSADWDADGNAFGVEFALGTDWNSADATNSDNLVVFFFGSNGGVKFGYNPSAESTTAWVLKRLTDLITDPFTEVYRYDGSTASTITTNIPVLVNKTASSIEVIDLSSPPPTNAFYQFSAEISP